MKRIILILLTILMGVTMADENYGVGTITKGNTEIIAEMIAKKTGGTLLHVEPCLYQP
jgi:flavodoxin